MKKQGFFQNLITICFLCFIGVFFLLSLYPFAAGGYRMLRELLSGTPTSFAVIEQVYNERLPAKNAFITLNGGLQRLLGSRTVNDRTLLGNGQLTYTIDAYDMTGIAGNTADFHDALAARGIPMVYVNAPFKIDEADKQLPVGVEDYSNENADRFLEILAERGVPALDLRENIHAQGLNHADLFYATDHHWKAETGFWAFGEITDYLTQRDSSFAVNEAVTDAANYEYTVYEDFFLGTAGRRTGPLYSGRDDLTVISPKFPTDLKLSVPEEGLERSGDYRDTVLFPEYLGDIDEYTDSRYNVYCGQDYGVMYLKNNGEATDKRILVVKDSYSSVVIPFMALGYKELCFVDLRLFPDDLVTFTEAYAPDMVMVLYNPGAYENNNLVMFEFMK